MADPEHLRILRQGVDAWNRWRGENPEVRPDLFRVDLSGANLTGANFSKANLSEAKLRWADLSGTNFSKAKVHLANLNRADLGRADLRGAVGLTQQQVDCEKGDEDTKLPEGIRRPVHWKRNPGSRISSA